MIPASNIKDAMKALATYLNIYYIRADQLVDVSTYPYFVYKVISNAEESDHQNVIVVNENSIDSTNADIVRYEKNETVISLTFIDKNDVSDIYTYATQALQWFKSISGKETLRGLDIIPRLIDPAPADRSVFLSALWENRVGFDIRFDYTGTYTQTIEAVETIEITPTIDGEEKSKITIEES